MVFLGDGLVLSLGSRMKKKEGKEVIEKRGGNRKEKTCRGKREGREDIQRIKKHRETPKAKMVMNKHITNEPKEKKK